MKRLYITTPIYYVNSDPHVGSAYTTLHADILSRFYRLNKYECKFLTGTDEHGQKIEESAKKLNINPQDFVDNISEKFRDLVKFMNYKPDYFEALNDDFMRTTKKSHKFFVQKVWRKMIKNDWLYEGSYKGWYCVSDEAYYTEDELLKTESGEFKTTLGKSVEWKEEKTYFFRLSEFQNILLKIYSKFPNFIKPAGKMSEIVSFVSGLTMKDYEAGKEPKKDYLRDLSVSRNNFDWGIKIPCDMKEKELLDKNGNWKGEVTQDEKHVIYVWFDALFNYLTAIACEFNEDYNKYWIENKNKIHLIGKDILRPHAVYWPAFLIAFNYTRKEVEEMADLNEDIAKILPTTVFAHGWLTNNGQKISKSLGNAILPSTEIEWIMNEFNLDLDIARDYFKYYLITATNFGNDGDYSRDRFVEKVNSELANKIGNLTKRTLDMIYKNCNQHIPKPEKIDNIFKDDISIYQEYLESFRFNEYVFEIMKNAEEANRYLEENAPWKLAKDNKIKEMENVLYSIANVIRKIAILLQPISPYVAERILKELNISFEDNIAFDKLNENLEFNLEILKPTIIIPRMQKK